MSDVKWNGSNMQQCAILSRLYTSINDEGDANAVLFQEDNKNRQGDSYQANQER